MDDTINGGVPLPGDILSPSSAAQNTYRDSALEDCPVLKDVENFEFVDLEVVEDRFVDTEEEFRVPEAQRRGEAGGRRAPECSTCRQAAAQGRSGRRSSECVPAGNSKSLEEGGNQQSRESNSRFFATLSYFSSLLGAAESPKPPITPLRASNTEVHEAVGAVATPQEAVPAIKTPGSRRSEDLNGRRVSWEDIMNRKKKGSSGSSGSLGGSSPGQLFPLPVIAGGNSATGGGPYAGDPLGIGVQLGDKVYSLMSTEVHTSEHSTSDGRVTRAEANRLTRTSPASEYREEPPSGDIRDEEVQIVVTSSCRGTPDETEDKESLVASRPKTGAVNRAITPSLPNFFQWSDAEGISFFAPGLTRREAPTPAIGPLGERGRTGSPTISRTPRVGVELPCLSAPTKCVHTPSFTRGFSPALTATESPNPNPFCSIHGESLTGRTHSASGRLAPPHGPLGASARGTQSGRHQSVIQEEREEFSRSFMDEPGSIRYYHPCRICDIPANNNALCFNQFRTVLTARRPYQEVCYRAFQPASLEFVPGELPRVFGGCSLLSVCSLSLPPPSINRHSHQTAVQNIICRHLVNNIFSAVVPSFCFNMEAIAAELMKLDPLKQALWQVLTIEALEALPQYETAAAKLRQKTVNEILVSIGAMSDSSAATLTESLQKLVKFAQDAWEPTFKSKAQTIPEVDVENGRANFKIDPKDSRLRGSSGLQVESITRPVLCLFPAIYQIVDGRDILVAPGRALFSDLYHSAEMELQAKLKTWNSDRRYARRASFMRSPFVNRNTHPPTSPESQSGRWSTRRMSYEHFGHNQRCLHPNDIEDGAIDFWDVSMHLEEYGQESLRHGRKSMGSETFSKKHSSYSGRDQSFNGSRRESVYKRQVPMGGRREYHYGEGRESLWGDRGHCRR
ncbi:hypothetical protein C7212DRAFT_282533 [Tuber magnatum]|uniref:Uncharacterized protein n=1 Tax=Tuber magnatum TaxID=42249 RepID=A0A317SNU4_9PEZI|nr:hypothetical protein C7212DRAFT_282533 [Tuber magnatum]